jgi:predicted acylesterase/phospholipase RssA
LISPHHICLVVPDTQKTVATLEARPARKVHLVDAAVASACAPAYFDHWRIDNINGRTTRFFDGGVGGAANPAYEARVEAFEFDTFTPADTRVIALGTGYFRVDGNLPGGADARVVCYLAFTTPPTVEDPVPLHESLP